MTSYVLNVPKSLSIGYIIMGTVGLGLSTLAVCMRLYIKFYLTRKARSEDYFSLLSLFAFGAFIGLGSVMIKSVGDIENLAYLLSIASILYGPIITIIKTSILLQYITVFVPQRRSLFNYAVIFLLWTNVIFYTVLGILGIFRCPPKRHEARKHCNIDPKLWVITGSFNILSDFSMLVLPLPLIWRLQVPLDKKFWIMMIFGLGSLACIASIIRLIYSVEVPHTSNPEVYIDSLKVGLVSYAEMAISIIVGCLPVLPRFFQHFSPPKNSPSSNSEAFLQSGSGSGLASRRRFFRKFPTPYASNAETRGVSRKMFSNKWARSKGPYISTLNFAGDTFHVTEGDLPNMPPACKTEVLSASMGHGFRGDGDTAYGTPNDIENAFPVAGITKTVHIEMENRAASNA